MSDISSLALKDEKYSLEDIAKSIMEVGETIYNKTIEAHKNGMKRAIYDLKGNV